MSSVSISHIGDLSYHTDRTDEKNYRTEYVSSVVFRNAGKTLFGDTPWYQSIEFDSPEAIDELIAALTYVRTVYKDQYQDRYEGIIRSIHRCNNEYKAIERDDGWKCDCCGEVTSSKYGDDNGRPKRCSECGAYFNEYVEKESEVDDEQ